MKTYNSIALALTVLCATLATVPCPAQNNAQNDADADLKAEVHALQQQAAALTQQIQLLQQKIDQKADLLPQPSAQPALTAQATDLQTADSQSAAPKAAASAIGPSQFVADSKATHGYFERKPGDRMTFYVPGGEFTTYGNLDVSVDATTKGIANEIGPDGNPRSATWDGCPPSPPTCLTSACAASSP